MRTVSRLGTDVDTHHLAIGRSARGVAAKNNVGSPVVITFKLVVVRTGPGFAVVNVSVATVDSRSLESVTLTTRV